MTLSHLIKSHFRVSLANEKLTEISILNAKETILKKIHVSLCFVKYSFSLNTYLNTSSISKHNKNLNSMQDDSCTQALLAESVEYANCTSVRREGLPFHDCPG